MDDIDVKILRVLQRNSRTLVSDISKEVSLSISAVSERIKRLEKSGLIKQYTTILKPSLLKKNLTAQMLVSLKSPNDSNRFLDFIKHEPDILSCYYIAGDYDYILKIVTESTKTLEKLLNRIKSMDCIFKTNTMVVLGIEKDNYSVSL